jgi:uncharacterized 2Fe-2S/4Fe-4S cluster protein (DUF4445 family)
MTTRKTTTAAAGPAAAPAPMSHGARALPPTVRSTTMLLLNEELARARTRDREADGANARLARTALSARKRQRRAWSIARRVRVSNSV